jgi:hypothetical protein
MKKKRKVVLAPVCDWCKQRNTNFIITASKLTFCLEQTLGEKPIKDCHAAYLNNIKSKQPSKPVEPELTKEQRAAGVAKLEAYRKELKQKQFAIRQKSFL